MQKKDLKPDEVAWYLLEKVKDPRDEIKGSIKLLKCCAKEPDVYDIVIGLLKNVVAFVSATVPTLITGGEEQDISISFIKTALRLLEEEKEKRKNEPVVTLVFPSPALPSHAPPLVIQPPLVVEQQQPIPPKDKEEEEVHLNLVDDDDDDDEESDSSYVSLASSSVSGSQEEQEEKKEKKISPPRKQFKNSNDSFVVPDSHAISFVEEEEEEKEKKPVPRRKRERRGPARFDEEDFEGNSRDEGVDLGIAKPTKTQQSRLGSYLKTLEFDGYEKASKMLFWRQNFGDQLKSVEEGCGLTGNPDFIREYLREPCFERKIIAFEAVSPSVKKKCGMCNGVHECSVLLGVTDKPSLLLGSYCASLAKKLLEFYMSLRNHKTLGTLSDKFETFKRNLAGVTEAHAAKASSSRKKRKE